MKKLFLTIATLFVIAGCGVQVNSNPVSTAAAVEDKVSEAKVANSKEETGKDELNRIEVPLLGQADGDTIKVEINGKEESVRFLLIDTPETSHPKLGEQPFGKEAKEFTHKLLSGKTVVLEKDTSETDKYDRLLRYVYTPDGRSVQEELLRNGLARVAYVYEPDTKYVDRYREIEKEAAEKKIGIWSVEGYAHIGHEHGYHTEVFENDKSKESKASSLKPAPASSTKATARFIASKNSEVFHEVGCPGGADKISPQNAIYFNTEEEAIDSGRRMCKSNLCKVG